MSFSKQNFMFFRRLRICVVAVMLMAGGYLGQILSAENRLYMMFNWQDTFVVLALIGGGGLAVTVVLHVGARVTKGLSDKWLSPWFYFIAVLIMFNLKLLPRERLVDVFPWLSPHIYYLLIWALGLFSTLGGYVSPRMNEWASMGWRGLAVIWPLMLIVPLSLAMAPKWQEVSGDPLQLGFRENGTREPVVIIILDMIGYPDVFSKSGLVRDELPDLCKFSEFAMVFHRARSPGYRTVLALPGLMLQEEVLFPLLEKDGVRWKTRSEPNMPARSACEFPMALPYRFRREGGRAVYIGYDLPYINMMPDAWDDAYILPYGWVEIPSVESRWADRCLQHILQYVRVSKDPFSGWLKQVAPQKSWEARYHRKLTRSVFNVGLRYVRDCLSAGDLAIIHLPIPHWPYVFDAHGNEILLEAEDPSGFWEQLKYADYLFGRYVSELKTCGKWEDAWVIVMSDHGRHENSWDLDSEKQRHVPFMVKAPRQAERLDIQRPIRLEDLDQIPGFSLALEGAVH